MPRVVGIDPGTVSVDLCGLEDGRVYLDRALPTVEVARAPERLVEAIAAGPVPELVVGPSGYGLPLVPLEAVGERELFLAFLPPPGGSGGIGGLRRAVGALRGLGVPVVFLPGVVHLPTVPAHRKANRIDLGTADKVAVAALAIEDQARRFGIPYGETAFVLVELGGAFAAVLAVDGGRIVDGLGGSSGPPGYRSAGALDGEVACLWGAVGKEVVFSGGAAYVAGAPDAPPEALLGGRGRAARLARRVLVEGVVKAVAAERAVVPRAREVLLSGRLCRIPSFYRALAAALARFGPVRRLGGFARVAKEAAQGAALLADGLAGGPYAALVDALRLRESGGTVLDHLYLAGAERVRRWVAERYAGPSPS